jgi:HEAT repeat protein
MRRGNRDEQLKALRLLHGFTRLEPSASTAVGALSSSPDPEIAFAALAILLKAGMPDGVAKFRRYVETYRQEQPPIELMNAAGELSLVADPKALPDIELLSGSKYLSIQMAAMDAIRHIGSFKSAPVLVERLDDPNRIVQYSAVITLAELFDKSGDYGPNIELFGKDPQKYIRLWKQWWIDEGKVLSEQKKSP